MPTPIGARMPLERPAIAERGTVVVHGMIDDVELEPVIALLDDEEARAGTGLVDEAERHRLGELARGARARDSAWHSMLAWVEDRVVGYAGVVLRDGGGASGDVAVTDPEGDPSQEVLRALLAASGDVAGRHGAERLETWTRRAGQPQVDAAAEEGFVVHRRLGILGRELEDDLPRPPASDVEIRSFRPGRDDEAVVAVLAAAYDGTDDGGWDVTTFEERTRLPWFRATDLLVAEVPEDGAVPRIAGLHWLKRRSDVQGEVYNLAVHPAAQGRRVGPALLAAGLAHLREVGCRDVLLWVDLANDRAVGLYTSQGFTTRSEDLALVRDLG